MDDAEAVLARYLEAQKDKDLESLVSCWHPDIEAEHPLRPDRSWRGRDTYRRQWARIWEQNPGSRFEVVSTAVVGNRIYLDALVEHAGATMVPCMNVLEVEGGQIRRARVYTDVPVHDSTSIDGFTRDLNPDPAPEKEKEPDAPDAFVAAINAHDADAVEACFHPDFEMVVPQKPARGFKGRDQEVKNMRFLFDTHPDFRVELLRKSVSGNEIWTETRGTATDLEMAVVTIWEIDAATGKIIRGRYYSDRVEHDAPPIDEFMESLGRTAPG